MNEDHSSTAKGSTRARAVRSVDPTVLPRSASRPSWAKAESRGRIAVSMPGSAAYVLLVGAEIDHVVEDCRS